MKAPLSQSQAVCAGHKIPVDAMAVNGKIICASVSHGNTSKVAAAVGEVLEAEVVKPQGVNTAPQVHQRH
jgi:hypothetical protein